jgi:hypothetical protein
MDGRNKSGHDDNGAYLLNTLHFDDHAPDPYGSWLQTAFLEFLAAVDQTFPAVTALLDRGDFDRQ